jgi:hypothetical protein
MGIWTAWHNACRYAAETIGGQLGQPVLAIQALRACLAGRGYTVR